MGMTAIEHQVLELEAGRVRDLAIDASESSVWVRRGGAWVCAVHTEAIAGDPFGRDRGAK